MKGFTDISLLDNINDLNSSKIMIYDIECDGLLDNATKIHCLSVSWRDSSNKIRTKSTSNYDEMRKFFLNKKLIRVGHNIALYDERVIEKILNINTEDSKYNIIDTLGLSRYLYPKRKKHGLESWGIDFSTHKVEIKDWKNQSSDDYIRRCEQDTIINLKLWEAEKNKLLSLYDNNHQEVLRLISYLQFKLDCVREQENNPLRFNVELAQKTLSKLIKEKESKITALAKVMPKVAKKKFKEYKDVIVTDDNEIIQRGELLFQHYFDLGFRPKSTHKEEKIIKYVDPNPNSVPQKKDWLFSLGWVPDYYKYEKEDKKDPSSKLRKIPQITAKDGEGEVCQSVKDLFIKEPTLEVLEGLTILTHRIGLIESLLESQKNGYIECSLGGFTNTLRLIHSNVVNIPKVSKPYGKVIRSLFMTNDENSLLCGSDMSSLEDTTKQHYIYPFDPEYVKEMSVRGFDPHLDLGLKCNIITKEEVNFYKSFNTDSIDKYSEIEYSKYLDIKEKRYKSKTTNFSSIYGVGASKLARDLKISKKEAKKLLDTYWERNKAVKEVEETFITKTINGTKWILNPVSKFWYELRADKDKFSTINQSTGCYCFDTYLKYIRMNNIKLSLQMHDETLFNLLKTDKSIIKDILRDSINKTNKELKLNVDLDISIDFGQNYASCH